MGKSTVSTDGNVLKPFLTNFYGLRQDLGVYNIRFAKSPQTPPGTLQPLDLVIWFNREASAILALLNQPRQPTFQLLETWQLLPQFSRQPFRVAGQLL